MARKLQKSGEKERNADVKKRDEDEEEHRMDLFGNAYSVERNAHSSLMLVHTSISLTIDHSENSVKKNTQISNKIKSSATISFHS